MNSNFFNTLSPRCACNSSGIPHKPTKNHNQPVSFSERLTTILAGPPTHRESAQPKPNFIIGSHTYEDIYDLAAGIGAAISPLDSTVCLCTQNKGIFAAALLASLSYGFTLVLPYAYSEQALKEVFTRLNRDDIKTRTAIIDRPMKLPQGVSAIHPLPRPHTAIPTTPAILPDAEFCHFFTGGSTGKPKIWSKTPRNLFAEAFYLSQKFGISASDRIVACVPPFHLYGFTFAVLLPLVSSASVAADIYTYPEEIRTALADYNASVFIGAPMHYRVLRESAIASESLRLAFSSTGKLDKADGLRFQKHTGADLVEIYGSTETGVIASRCRAMGDRAFKPLDVVDWKIHHQGLYVRSPFIAPGIEKSADGFFSMGDRVRLCSEDDPKAGFELIGRADGIVKVGGKRADLEEIRQKIKQTPDVEDAVVIAHPTGRGRENTISALVQGDIDSIQLRKAISTLLEPYAIPRQIKTTSAIPMLPTGKYDRKAIEVLFFRSK
ncbi:class I adenylate-forming enzyme family protein [Desulfococcaceae bacterium HSG9]|nr:class I adenylate-forming enzyme family protein [Desulfococcaceae bacterium HSG9]